MSNLSQFFSGGGSAPLGSITYLTSYDTLITTGGNDYLVTGVLYPIAGYTEYAQTFPTLSVNTSSGTTPTYFNVQSVRSTTGYHLGLGKNNSTGTIYSMPVSGGDWSAVSGTSLANDTPDATAFNNLVIYSAGTNVNVINSSNTVTTGVTTMPFSNYYCFASSSTLGLAVVVSHCGAADGAIKTSTNGTTWTSRTPNGTSNEWCTLAFYCPVINKFVYLNTAGDVYTTSDGYTLTKTGSAILPTGTTNQSIGYGSAFMSDKAASSSTSSVIIVHTTTGTNIYRTTDATNFTDITSNVPKGGGSSLSKVYYAGGKYYVTSGMQSTYVQSYTSVSSDDGLTWSALPAAVVETPFNQSYTYVTRFDQNGVGFVFGNLTNQSFAGATSKVTTFSNLSTETHIGTILPNINYTSTSNSTQYGYIRIK